MPKSVTQRVGGAGEPDRARRSPALTALTRLIERTGASATSASAFGTPVRSGATTVVPVARVSLMALMGGGSSRVPTADGAGGLGLARVRPSGYVVLDDSGASFRPIRQPAALLAIPLAAITAVAVTRIVGVSVREARRRRKLALLQSAVTPPATRTGCECECESGARSQAGAPSGAPSGAGPEDGTAPA
jgi:uncharacterized spore protein YtfJ